MPSCKCVQRWCQERRAWVVEMATRVLRGYERSLNLLLNQRNELDARIAEWRMRVDGQARKVERLTAKAKA